MIRNYTKAFTGLFIILYNLQATAEDTLKVTVKTHEKTAFGIGYSVGGKIAGSIGKSYTGTGPKNKKYFFGYRRNTLHGANIFCGTLTLTQDSIVTLVVKDNKCIPAVE